MKKTLIICMAIFVIIFAGCSSNQPQTLVKNGEMANSITASQSKDYYETIGLGAPSPNAKTSASKKQTSRDAARVAASNQIASYLYGLKLDSGITVKDAETQNSTINAQVSAFLRGAEEIKAEWDDEFGCAVTMRINLVEFKKRLQELGVK